MPPNPAPHPAAPASAPSRPPPRPSSSTSAQPPRRGAAAQGRRDHRAGRVPAAPLRAPLRAEKSGFWQPGPPGSPLWKAPDLGFRRPRPRRRRPATAKWGGKIAKSPIFPHIGTRERDGAGASGRRPDRKRGRGTPVGRYTPKGESERMFHVKHSGPRRPALHPSLTTKRPRHAERAGVAIAGR